MTIIFVSPNDNLDISVKKFRKEVDRQGTLKELKERRFHKKPALVRKQEAIKLRKKIKKSMRKKRYQMRNFL